MSGFRTSDFRLLADGLEYPAGPVYQSDGGILVVEIRKGTLTRVKPGGTKQVLANLGGGPNGAAVGPDGAIYVCNDGGMTWLQIPATPNTLPVLVALGQPPNYTGGSIQRVNPKDDCKSKPGIVSATTGRSGDRHPAPWPQPGQRRLLHNSEQLQAGVFNSGQHQRRAADR